MAENVLLILLMFLMSRMFCQGTLEDLRNIKVFNCRDEVFNVVVDNRTGDVFVGGRNVLYHLDSDLVLKEEQKTGPVQDRLDCPPPPTTCFLERKDMNNDNKVLLILYDNQTDASDKLIACGSRHKGRCILSSTKNIHSVQEIGDPEDITSYIAGLKSVVAFLATSPDGRLALYSASEYDNRPMNLTSPDISSKILVRMKNGDQQEKTFFQYSVHANDSITGIYFNSSNRIFRSKYIYGFTYGNFSYFVMFHAETLGTRLARVCNYDRNFSYTEVPMRCTHNNTEYNRANAAYLGSAGTTVERMLNLDHNDKVLYIAFGKTKEGYGIKPYHSHGSIICSFPMSSIIKEFTNVIQDCFQAGKKSKILERVWPQTANESCQKKDIDINDSFCGSDINKYIEGRDALVGNPRIRISEDIITSLVVVEQNTKPVAFLGTDRSQIIKILLDHQREQYLHPENDFRHESINPSMAFDKTKSNIYLLTGKQVVKFPIGSCSPYTSCEECLTKEDPLGCHWCGTYCAQSEECENPALLQNHTCPPIIKEFEPKSGPVDGGTKITIRGDNFGSSKSDNGIKPIVRVGDSDCEIKTWNNKKIQCVTPRTTEPKKGKIYIEIVDPNYINGKFRVNGNFTSKNNFSYEIPVIYSVVPVYGPVSGGTVISVSGENLHIGSNQVVHVAGVQCQISKPRSPNTITCTTGKYGGERNEEVLQHFGPIIVKIDNTTVQAVDEFSNQTLEFRYLKDPVINKVSPQKSILSGGTILTVEGSYLNSVARPRLIITAENNRAKTHEQTCNVTNSNGTVMKCPIPSMKNVTTLSTPIEAHIVFLMDGVKTLKDLPKLDPSLSRLIYYPDPILTPFMREDNALEVFTNDPVLDLKGMNLDLALRQEDINVTVLGIGHCVVTSISNETLSCRLSQSAVDKRKASEYYSVKFQAGFLTYDVGFIKFVDSIPASITTHLIVTTSLLIIILFILILFAYMYYARKWLKKQQINWLLWMFRRNKRIRVESDRRGKESNDYNAFSPGDKSLRHLCTKLRITGDIMQLLTDGNLLIPQEYILLEEVIGQGHFGCVHKGNLQVPEKEVTPVAIKTLKNDVLNTEQDSLSFLKEGLIMKDFNHKNILTLIGVTFDDVDNTPMVIIPYMPNGDLLSYLRSEKNTVTVKDLIHFGLQIADGMNYLAHLKFVHRDLAARNCMLDGELNVKVADFGLSRDIYEREYYSSDNKKAKLPVKWMAPESLEKGIYSSKTDVWAYGVLLWELMTRGVTPYPDVDNWDILQFLKQGRRMLQPSYCPDMLYRIMLQCWHSDPEERPAFADLVDEVQHVLTRLEQNRKQRSVGFDVNYINYPLNNNIENV